MGYLDGVLASLASILAGCSPSLPEGALPLLDGPGFFDRPFPSDHRLVDGHPDFAGFPLAEELPLVGAYVEAAAMLRGWSTVAPVYVRFAEDIDPDLLPSAEESIDDDSPVLLLDVDTESPHRGEAVPVQVDWEPSATDFHGGRLLAVAPVFGFPLRPSTTYALVLRSPLARPGAMDAAWEDAEDTVLAPLHLWLDEQGIEPLTVAAATVFTTDDPTAETRRIGDAISGEIGAVNFDPDLEVVEDRGDLRVYATYATVPNWQHGLRPYREDGGFRFDEEGRPIVAHWERVRCALTVPEGDEPPSGWPVVLYSHGTGGNWTTAWNGGATDEAAVLGNEGVALIAISQPLHADRATPETDPELDTFNYLNPVAARTNFRQGALDQVYLAHLLHDLPMTFLAPDRPIRLDPDRVAYFGHSQGGMVGALAAPIMAEDVVAAGFSGTGGVLSIAVIERKDPLDIAAAVAGVLGLSDASELDTFHPVIGLVQSLGDAVDPVNYAPYWFAERAEWSTRPVPALLTEGLLDAYTPANSSEALAAAARLPVLGEAASEPDAFELRGIEADALPTSENARDWNGDAISAGVAQYPEDGHFAIYDNRDARGMYREFLSSALAGAPAFP